MLGHLTLPRLGPCLRQAARHMAEAGPNSGVTWVLLSVYHPVVLSVVVYPVCPVSCCRWSGRGGKADRSQPCRR